MTGGERGGTRDAALARATLAIEASTYAGSVAVTRDGVVVAAREVAMRGQDEERLLPAVAAVLADAGVAPHDLARVVCGSGPGSFTSLRIAASIAKGIAVAAGLPLLAVPSPALMLAARLPALRPGRYLTALDAMRGELFVCCLELGEDGRIATLAAPALAPAAELTRLAKAFQATTLGPGLAIDARPHARGAAALGHALAVPAPVDVASWEPDYGRLAEAQVKWERAHGRPLAGGA